MIFRKTFLIAMLIASNSLSTIRADNSTPLPVEISPADPLISYSGRFDTRDKNAPRCAWSACTVRLKFSGTAINARLADEGHNFWQVEIDGTPSAKLELQRGDHLYPIATALPAGEHTVVITKATEGFAGTTQFLGFQLNEGAKTLALPPMSRRIEVIGDSISCGYGVEVDDPHLHFSTSYENATIAYGALAARKFGADYTCVAYSGRKMWPDNTIPEIYDRTLTREEDLKWDFTSWIPDVVIINLGTNDFGNQTPESEPWIDAYRKFIARVRANYPTAAIYCATGPMLTDDGPVKSKSILLACVQKIVEVERTSGDKKIHALDFGQQDLRNGVGADWHPGRKTQLLMARQLVEVLQRDMGW